MRRILLIAVTACSNHSAPRDGNEALAAALETFSAPDASEHREHALELMAQACEFGNRHGCEVIVDGASPYITRAMLDRAIDHLRTTCRDGDVVSCRAIGMFDGTSKADPGQAQRGCDAGF